MKKYTQQEFKELTRDEYGIKNCPTGDYTAIRIFGDRCSFGQGCSFGEGCRAKSPFWSFVYEPPFETTSKIYPTALAREYWQSRLGIDLAGCYKDIEKVVTLLIPDILTRTDLTACERRIIESWKGED